MATADRDRVDLDETTCNADSVEEESSFVVVRGPRLRFRVRMWCSCSMRDGADVMEVNSPADRLLIGRLCNLQSREVLMDY